jgi:hypothetical protein
LVNSGIDGIVATIRGSLIMKFYERLNLVERKKMVLNAVASSSVMEGMLEAKIDCLKELERLENPNVALRDSPPIVQKY